ncbi:hypothetical protein TNCV_1949871 [Trichonephila clavipes]|nr:hypothetical protein TNCV_1949871 [Trichonephila clavipes]
MAPERRQNMWIDSSPPPTRVARPSKEGEKTEREEKGQRHGERSKGKTTSWQNERDIAKTRNDGETEKWRKSGMVNFTRMEESSVN